MSPLPRILGVSKAKPSSDGGLGHGMDLALVSLLFLGIGYALDRWLGTKPVFMISLFLIAMVGQFIKMWYAYDLKMRAHEAERDLGSRSGAQR